MKFMSFCYKEGEDLLDYCGRFEQILSKLEINKIEIEEISKVMAFSRGLPETHKTWVKLWRLANRDGMAVQMISEFKMDQIMDEPQPKD